jgi:hypothetical protein
MLFTAETAATFAKKRWEAERKRKAQPRILPAPLPDDATQTPIQAEVVRVRGQIESINQQLDNCEDPDEWDCLTRSKERLFRIWARLAQIPMDPKASTKLTAQRRAYPEPTPAAPQAVVGEANPSVPSQSEHKPLVVCVSHNVPIL